MALGERPRPQVRDERALALDPVQIAPGARRWLAEHCKPEWKNPPTATWHHGAGGGEGWDLYMAHSGKPLYSKAAFRREILSKGKGRKPTKTVPNSELKLREELAAMKRLLVEEFHTRTWSEARHGRVQAFIDGLGAAKTPPPPGPLTFTENELTALGEAFDE